MYSYSCSEFHELNDTWSLLGMQEWSLPSELRILNSAALQHTHIITLYVQPGRNL